MNTPKLALVVVLLVSCASPRAVATSTAPREVPAPKTTPPRWTPREPVRVRLAGFEHSTSLEIRRGANELLRVTRDDGKVKLGDEPAVREVRVASRGGDALRIGERHVIGELAIRAGTRGGFELDALVDLEVYVEGVLAGELPLWSASSAELEAQAIAARSYAVCALRERASKSPTPYLFDDTRDQVFDGPPVLGTRGEAARVAGRVRAALATTRDQVLMENGRVVDARFCGACGGRTANASEVAPEADFECLRSVECAICREDYVRPLAAASARTDDLGWRARVTARELASAFALDEPRLELTATRTDAAGRWITVEARGASASKTLTFAELRARLPDGRLASNWIVAARAEADGAIAFVGRGRGHGVGLCQRGARGLAARGRTSSEILAHYFPGATVERLDR